MSQSTIQKSAAEENAAVQTEAAVNKGQADVLDQLLKPEVQEALTVLVDNLPKLSEMVTVLTKTYDVAQSLLTDDVLKEDLLGGVKEFIEPVEGTVKGLAATAIEATIVQKQMLLIQSVYSVYYACLKIHKLKTIPLCTSVFRHYKRKTKIIFIKKCGRRIDYVKTYFNFRRRLRWFINCNDSSPTPKCG